MLRKAYVLSVLIFAILLSSPMHANAATIALKIQIGSWFNKTHYLKFDEVSQLYKRNYYTSDYSEQCLFSCGDPEYAEYESIFESITINATVSKNRRDVTYYWEFYNVWTQGWDSEDGIEYININTARNRYIHGAETGGWYQYESNIKAATRIQVSPVPLPLTGVLLGSGLAALGVVGRRRRQNQAAASQPVTGR